MSYDSNIIRAASARLEERRRQRQDRLSTRRGEIYARVPRVKQIDYQLQQTVISVLSAALRHGKDPAPAVAQARQQNLSLQEERAQLLISNGYPPTALDDIPQCAKCKDSGWIGAEMCTCLRDLCAQEQIKQLSSLLDLGEQSFENFRLDYYSDQPYPTRPCSPRENMKMVLEICGNYAMRFPKFAISNLYLTGAPGLGKTFLSGCIAREVSQKGYSVVYDTAGNIFGQFEAQKFQKDADAGLNTHRYLNCDLLILDDLGSEMTTSFTQSVLYEIINTRMVGNKFTIISSNLSLEQVRKRYQPQIASRICGEYRPLVFYGEDIRQLLGKRPQ